MKRYMKRTSDQLIMCTNIGVADCGLLASYPGHDTLWQPLNAGTITHTGIHYAYRSDAGHTLMTL